MLAGRGGIYPEFCTLVLDLYTDLYTNLYKSTSDMPKSVQIHWRTGFIQILAGRAGWIYTDFGRSEVDLYRFVRVCKSLYKSSPPMDLYRFWHVGGGFIQICVPIGV